MVLNKNDQDLLDYSRGMIHYAVTKHKEDVTGILNKNGVQVPPNADTKTLHFITLKTLGESKSFKNDLADVLSHIASGSKKIFSNASGERTGYVVSAKDANGNYIKDLDCGVINKGAKYSTFSSGNNNDYANQDGSTTTPAAADNSAVSDSVTLKDLLGKGLDLGIAYMAAQGSKGVNNEVNNADAIAKAQAAAQAAADKQKRNFEIFAVVVLLAVVGYAFYKLKKK